MVATSEDPVAEQHELRRALGPIQLVGLGIGAIIGAGIFVSTGQAAAQFAGPGVVISYAFAGFGCLLAGCCFGRPTDVPWAITFTDPVAYANAGTDLGTPLHPTQLYDSISGMLLCLVTLAYYPFRRRTGEVLALGWIAYPINRFMIEFLRSDEAGQFGTSLTIAQWVSLGLFASGVMFYLALRYISPGRQPVIVAHAPTSTT